MSQIAAHPKIEILLGAKLAECQGEAGDFRVTLAPEPTSEKPRPTRRGCEKMGLAPGPHLERPRKNGLPMVPVPIFSQLHGKWEFDQCRTVPCQAVVLATGFDPYDPTDNLLLGYGHFDDVITTRDLDDILREDDLSGFAPEDDTPLRVAFIQCVGSRDRKSGREYCSQFCCRTTIRLVQRLRYLRPNVEATVFYIDLQIMSKEFGTFYDRAREEVRFIQGVPAEVCPGEAEGTLRVYSVAPGADRTEAFEFDRVVLAIGLVPTDSHHSLAEAMRLDLNEFGYFAGRGPDTAVEASRPGVLLAGACSGPTDIQGSRRQALAVAGLLAQRLGEDNRRKATRQIPGESDVHVMERVG